MRNHPSRLTMVLARATVALAGLLAAAAANAEFVRVTAANSVGNLLYDATSFTPGGPGTTSPLNSDGASHGSFSSLVQVANLATGTVDILVADAVKGQLIRYTPAVGATAAAVQVVWTATGGQCNGTLDGLSADAAGDLFFVLQNKPTVCVLPVSASSATGYAAQPLLVDVNGYSSLGAGYLRETTVATVAGAGWAVGDLLVLGSSKNSSNKTLVYVYRAASLNSVISGGGARNGPDIALISPGQFTWGGNPAGMDIWPADALDSNPTLLLTNSTGQVLRLDFTSASGGYAPRLVQVFATGLGSGLLKIKEGLQLGIPYAFVTQSGSGNGRIVMLGAPASGGNTNLIGIATQGVQSPNALAVARQAAIPASSCVFPATCDLSGGVLPHTITGSTTGQITGNVLEASCVVLADPRITNGVCDGTSLNVATLCPGFGNEIIPGTMCGSAGASHAGFALLRTITTGVDNHPGLLVNTEENVDQILPPTPPATNPQCPNAVLAWVPRSDAVPSEGSIVEVDPQTGLQQLVDMTTFCDASGGSNRGLSIWGVGLALNANALSGGLPGFAQTKYDNLFATVAGANILPVTQTALEAALTPINAYMAQGDYACAALQVLNADTQVAQDPNPAGNYPGSAANPNPWGEVRGRLGNLYMTLNTRLLGNPPNFAWPLASTDVRPVCAPPVVTLKALPASIAPLGTTTISWSTQHANSCQAGLTAGDPGWSSAHGTSGSYGTVALSGNASYTLSCTGAGGTTAATVTVTVVPPPSITSFAPASPSVPVGGSTTLSWSEGTGASCAVDGLPGPSGVSTGPLSTTTTYTLTCTNSLGTATTATKTVTVVPAPSITAFVVTPSSIPSGGSAKLTWSASTGASCAVNGLPGASGVSTGAVSVTTTYTLTCTSVGGTATAMTTLTVVAAPKITSFKATPSNVDPDCVRDHQPSSCSFTTLSWTSTNAVSCAIAGGGLNRSGLPTSGSTLSNKITAKTTFALACSNSVNATATATTTVTYLDLDDRDGD